jgi:hypothetical protein
LNGAGPLWKEKNYDPRTKQKQFRLYPLKKTPMKLLTYLTLAILPFKGMAGDHLESITKVSYEIVKTSVDSKLKKTEAAFDFVFVDRSNVPVKGAVQYSYNGKNASMAAGGKGRHTQKLAPGKYTFQFFYNKKHTEVYTDSIEIKPANRIELKVYFDRSDIMIIADKPVIYLYPEKTTEVQVQLEIGGDFLFTYPNYEKGWNVTAEPNGILHQGDKTFNYLFWEGKTRFPAVSQTTEGFVRSTNELTAFFEEKLSQLGLNGREVQDFITYWVPRMQQYPRHCIRFVLNDEYNEMAAIKVSPRPDCTIRVFMLWEPLQPDQTITVKEQTLPVLERKGFTLVEWGGTQITAPDAE